jgi:hypothetical protein
MTVDENEFINSIDCNFPYNDRGRVIGLIDQAKCISENAMFAVLEELCRPGHGTQVSKATLLELIDVWDDKNDHPLAEFVVSAARLTVNDTQRSVEEALALLEKIAPFTGLYAALCIASKSADDTDGVLDIRDEEIRLKWAAQ